MYTNSRVVALIATVLFVVSGCGEDVFEPGCFGCTPEDSIQLRWWFVNGWQMEARIGTCDMQYDQLKDGGNNHDTRLWSVGSWFSVSPHFFGECEDPQGLMCDGPDFELETADSSIVVPDSNNDSLLYVAGAGLAKIFARAYDSLWGPLTLRTAEPAGLYVTRLTHQEYEEPLSNLAIADSGSIRLVVRVLDLTAHHLCGRPAMEYSSRGLSVSTDSAANPEIAGNGVVKLEAGDATEAASVELSVGDATETVEFDWVQPDALTSLAASVHKGVVRHWIRVRAYFGNREVAGAKVNAENLTPNLYSFAGHENETEIATRAPALELIPNDTGAAGTARMRLTLPGSAVDPLLVEFSIR